MFLEIVLFLNDEFNIWKIDKSYSRFMNNIYE